MNSNQSFKEKHTFEQRQKNFERVYEKYPTRIPVIIEKNVGSKINDIDKIKFLVPNDQTVGQLIYIIRKRIQLKPNEAIFVFVNNTLPRTSDLLKSVYLQNKDPDGFLYLTYSGENTFGNIFRNINMDTFEEQLFEYFDYLRTIKPRSYLSYRRTSEESPLYFYNGME